MDFANEIHFCHHRWRGESAILLSYEIDNNKVEKSHKGESDLLEAAIREYITNRKSLFFAGAAVFIGSLALLVATISLIVTLALSTGGNREV